MTQKHWDEKLLADNYAILAKMRESVESIINNSETEILLSQLPNSLMPTDVLYGVCICYEYMYDKLMEAELASSGYHKQSKNLH